MLSNNALDAYWNVKVSIKKVFHLIDDNNKGELKEEFCDYYIRFARRLKKEGHRHESYEFMSLCRMYSRLIDRPTELINHKKFFNDLFDAFGELLDVKFNSPEEYGEKYREYKDNFRKARRYYYTEVAIPSPHYDKGDLHEITSNILKVVE